MTGIMTALEFVSRNENSLIPLTFCDPGLRIALMMLGTCNLKKRYLAVLKNPHYAGLKNSLLGITFDYVTFNQKCLLSVRLFQAALLLGQ